MNAPRFRPTPRLVDGASILLLVGALLAWVLPIGRARSAPVALALPGNAVANGGDAPDLAARDSSYAGIVRGNLFSATRRTPSSRFVPPAGSFGAAAPTDAPMAVQETVAPTADAGSDDAPTLYGIVTVDGVRRALLSLAPGQPPQLHGIGEGSGRFRVREIRADRVLISTPGGIRTLRLATPPTVPSDSSSLLP